MRLSGRTKIAGVIGHPITHSRSPLLHSLWLEKYQIDGVVVPLDISPSYLKEGVNALPKLGFKGASVTIPHKENIAALMNTLEQSAQIIGAVNMIYVTTEGHMHGANTDHFGFIENLRQQVGWDGTGKRAIVLGAGGAARGVVYGLAEVGAKSITIVNRTEKKSQKLIESFSRYFPTHFKTAPWDNRESILSEADILINTTSLGMGSGAPLELDLKALPQQALVTDIVYTPLMTDLLLRAKEKGHPVVDGLGMLIHQGRPAFKAWFGKDPQVTDDIREALLKDLGGEKA